MNALLLGSGTGFIVERGGTHYLITNYHVLSGRDAQTGKPIAPSAATPTTVRVWQHRKGQLGTWTAVDYPLIDEAGNPRWKDKTLGAERADVAALALPNDPSLDLHPLDLGLATTDIIVAPSDPVSIIGFPYSTVAAGKFPIWKTGHVASDIDLDFATKPIFLIDATTKPGMSGSPVIVRRTGMVQTSGGIVMGGSSTRLMGVYSGRVPDTDLAQMSNLGLVWKPLVIEQLLA